MEVSWNTEIPPSHHPLGCFHINHPAIGGTPIPGTPHIGLWCFLEMGDISRDSNEAPDNFKENGLKPDSNTCSPDTSLLAPNVLWCSQTTNIYYVYNMYIYIHMAIYIYTYMREVMTFNLYNRNLAVNVQHFGRWLFDVKLMDHAWRSKNVHHPALEPSGWYVSYIYIYTYIYTYIYVYVYVYTYIYIYV